MSSVNDQITDAVNQINAVLGGGAPAQSMGMLDVTSAETMGMSMFNAITAQQNAQTSANAAATASCAKMLNTEIIPPAPSTKGKEHHVSEAQQAESRLENKLLLATLKELQIHDGVRQSAIDRAFEAAAKGMSESMGKKIKTLEMPFKAHLSKNQSS